MVAARPTITQHPFTGRIDNGGGKAAWAICWPLDEDGFVSSYCHTLPTPQGGSHEKALRAALYRGLRAYGELTGNKRAAQIIADAGVGGASRRLSGFVPDPPFQRHTTERSTES